MNIAQMIAADIVSTAVQASLEPAAQGRGSLERLTEQVGSAYGRWSVRHAKHDGDHTIERAQLRVDVYETLQTIGFNWSQP